ncbi:MAG: trypsin-like peptidase domain-containing protein [Gammaproteobacteria bacterium]|nr:trypsin-like peptidase domain-containing protein [Gammaproteobacteria bacterium]
MSRTRALLSVAAALFLLTPLFAPRAQIIVGPGAFQMEVLARVAGDGGEKQVISLADGAALRTGDGVQIRIRAARDAYVYVIAYGSSESAVVLQPFSGNHADARMRAGEERTIPGPNRFLPLDRRAGVESIYAFASATPVRLLSSLLVRMESQGSDRNAVTRTLRSAQPDTLGVSFRHLDAPKTADSGSAAPPGGLAFQGQGEEGVLSAEGSRIQAFVTGAQDPAGPETSPRKAPDGGADPATVPAAPPAPAPAAKRESTGWLGRLFGIGDEKSSPADKPAPEAVAATTYALPSTREPDAGNVELTADAATGAGSEDVSPAPPPPDAPAGAPAPAEDVNPQLNVSALDDIVASLGDTSADGRGEVVAATPEPATEPATAVPEPAPGTLGGGNEPAVSEAKATPVKASAEAGAAGAATAPADPATTSPEQDSLRVTQPPEPDGPPQQVAEEPSPDPTGAGGDTEKSTSSGGFFSRLFGGGDSTPDQDPPPPPESPAVNPPPEPAPAAPPASEVAASGEPAPERDAAPDSGGDAAEDSGGGFFSRLFGGGGGADTNAPPPASATETETPEPDPPAAVADAAPEAAEVPAATPEGGDAARAQEEPARAVLIGQAGSPSASEKTVLIGPADTPPPETAAPPEAPDPAAPEATGLKTAAAEADAPGPDRAGPEPAPAPDAAVPENPAAEPEAPETGKAGGFLSGLSSLFGSGSPAEPEAVAESAAPAGDDAPAGAGPAPGSTDSVNAPVEQEAQQPAPTLPADQTASTPETSGDGETGAPAQDSGGFLSGLANLFSGPSKGEGGSQPGQDGAGEPPPEPASPVVSAPPEEPPPAEPADDAQAGSGGFFGGLSRLFGGDGKAPASAAAETGNAAAPPDPARPESRPEPEAQPGPAFKTVTRSDGTQVVIVEGPPGRPDAPSPSSEVLSGEGSKIRALLSPDKRVDPDRNVVAQVREGEVVPASSPSGNADTEPASAQVPPAAPSGPRVEVAEASDSPAVTASAAGAEQESEVKAVSPPPAPPVQESAAVVPDQVQAALESGAVQARAPAETLAALTAPPPATEAPVSPVEEIDVSADDNVSSAIVLVVTPTGTGSGVLLDDAGHVLANWHVVNGYTTVSVSFKAPDFATPSMERTYSAKVIRLNKTADLALLRINAPPPDVSPVRFAAADGIGAGEVLHAIGHPASGAWTHTLGKIDRVKPESSWYAGRNLLHRGTVIQAKVLDDPGSAGAPLFNNRLELVGISAEARSKRGVLTGVSVETIRRFLESPPAGG